MKTCILTLTFLFFGFTLFGQNDLSIGFNSTVAGRNIALGYSKTIKSKHELGIGLRININKKKHPDDQNCVFYKRLFATEFEQYLGLQASYHRNILSNWQYVNPYLFYDFQITNSSTWNRMFLPYAYDTNGDVLYKEYREYFGPYWWLEQNIGIGFKAKLTNSFYLFQNIGVGGTILLGMEKKLPETYDKFTWEFGYLISIGIAYRIKD